MSDSDPPCEPAKAPRDFTTDEEDDFDDSDDDDRIRPRSTNYQSKPKDQRIAELIKAKEILQTQAKRAHLCLSDVTRVNVELEEKVEELRSQLTLLQEIISRCPQCGCLAKRRRIEYETIRSQNDVRAPRSEEHEGVCNEYDPQEQQQQQQQPYSQRHSEISQRQSELRSMEGLLQSSGGDCCVRTHFRPPPRDLRRRDTQIDKFEDLQGGTARRLSEDDVISALFDEEDKGYMSREGGTFSEEGHEGNSSEIDYGILNEGKVCDIEDEVPVAGIAAAVEQFPETVFVRLDKGDVPRESVPLICDINGSGGGGGGGGGGGVIDIEKGEIPHSTEENEVAEEAVSEDSISEVKEFVEVSQIDLRNDEHVEGGDTDKGSMGDMIKDDTGSAVKAPNSSSSRSSSRKHSEDNSEHENSQENESVCQNVPVLLDFTRPLSVLPRLPLRNLKTDRQDNRSTSERRRRTAKKGRKIRRRRVLSVRQCASNVTSTLNESVMELSHESEVVIQNMNPVTEENLTEFTSYSKEEKTTTKGTAPQNTQPCNKGENRRITTPPTHSSRTRASPPSQGAPRSLRLRSLSTTACVNAEEATDTFLKVAVKKCTRRSRSSMETAAAASVVESDQDKTKRRRASRRHAKETKQQQQHVTKKVRTQRRQGSAASSPVLSVSLSPALPLASPSTEPATCSLPLSSSSSSATPSISSSIMLKVTTAAATKTSASSIGSVRDSKDIRVESNRQRRKATKILRSRTDNGAISSSSGRGGITGENSTYAAESGDTRRLREGVKRGEDNDYLTQQRQLLLLRHHSPLRETVGESSSNESLSTLLFGRTDKLQHPEIGTTPNLPHFQTRRLFRRAAPGGPDLVS